VSGAYAPTAIGPAAYALWRATRLGATTEAIEQALILELMGELGGRDVLDVGCGDGALLRTAAARGAKATGIDADLAMLAAARRKVAAAGVDTRLLEGKAELLPFPDASFDVVVAITVLCFVADATGAVREMARVLRPGGRLVLGELGRWSLWAAVRRVRGWLGAATWKAAQFRSAGGLRMLAEQADLSVTALRGAVYYPPVGFLARALGPIDSWIGKLTTFGAAFLALSAVAASEHREERACQ
jgi:SAM-dependent methyltransferase